MANYFNVVENKSYDPIIYCMSSKTLNIYKPQKKKTWSLGKLHLPGHIGRKYRDITPLFCGLDSSCSNHTYNNKYTNSYIL